MTRRHMRRFVMVLDTGAGSILIRKDILLQSQWPFIHPVNVGGKITLAVELVNRVEAVSFYFVECLSTQDLLGLRLLRQTCQRYST